MCLYIYIYIYIYPGVLISSKPYLFPDVILFDGVNISFDASLVIYVNSTNIPPIIITKNRHREILLCE